MTRDEAYIEMQKGNKITHQYFAPDEYYYIKNGGGVIFSEDGVNHSMVFKSTDQDNWRENGWYLYQEQ